MPYKDPNKLKEWRSNNSARIAAHSAKYYRAHPGKHRVSKLAWRRANPAREKAHACARRTRKTAAGGSFTHQEWLDLCNKYGNVCLRCRQKKPLTPDHVIPVVKGGSSNISNIQPLCQSCNSTKHTDTTDYRVFVTSLEIKEARESKSSESSENRVF